jgi:hypothetical protein
MRCRGRQSAAALAWPRWSNAVPVHSRSRKNDVQGDRVQARYNPTRYDQIFLRLEGISLHGSIADVGRPRQRMHGSTLLKTESRQFRSDPGSFTPHQRQEWGFLYRITPDPHFATNRTLSLTAPQIPRLTPTLYLPRDVRLHRCCCLIYLRDLP